MCLPLRQKTIMGAKNIDYRQVETLYETCSDGRDLKEFCKDAGVCYESFVNWRRKEFVAKKKGTASPVMAPVEITDVPAEASSERGAGATCKDSGSNSAIRFVEMKFSDGLSLRRYNMEIEELVTLLTKLSAALC